MEKEEENREKPNLKGDYVNSFILFLLYILQGVPMGIANTIIVLMQKQGVSYSDQTLFSVVFYPFTFKILWAPLVDCMYFKAIGRRKTWLVPTQLLIGASMVFLAGRVDDWFHEGSKEKPPVVLITLIFFLIYFLTATQDIAVDGWALTMVQKRNVGYVATINCVGQSFGALLGFVVFLTLESKDFCNRYIFDEPQAEGLLKFSAFLMFWGVSFLTVTIGIALFKRESSEADEVFKDNPDFGIRKAYPILWKIISLKPILMLASVLSTSDISFAAVDAISHLKLIDYGVPKDMIAIYNIPSFIVQLALPLVISKYTAGKYPLRFFVHAFPFRLLFSGVYAVFVYFSKTLLADTNGVIPVWYSLSIMTISLFYQIAMRSMYTGDMAFFARVADPLMAGSYMTVMNVVYVGAKIIKSFSIWLVDIISWKSCAFDNQSMKNFTESLSDNKCSNEDLTRECIDGGGFCRIDIDGFYILVVVNLIFGIFWYARGRKVMGKLENMPVNDWHVLSNQNLIKSTELTELKKDLL